MADDVLIASLALLATSWAGVTFATNGGANTAISNLLQSKPAVKLSLAGLITKKLVVDGTKLLLTRDVRDAFETVLPEIKSFFQAESDAVTSSNTGSLSGGYVVGASYSFPVYDHYIYSFSDFGGTPELLFSPDLIESFSISSSINTLTFNRRPFSEDSVIYSTPSGSSLIDVKNGQLWGVYSDKSGGKYEAVFYSLDNYRKTGFPLINCGIPEGDVYTLTILTASDSIPFQTSKEVDGTSALEILKPAPLYVVNPGGNEGGDGSSKPEINFKYGMLALEGLIGTITLGGQEAQKDKDPGLKPDEMVNDLQQAMNSAGQNPNPNPNPEPQPNPEPEPAPDPDTPGGEGTPPQFNQMVIPNLKDFFPFCIPGDIKKMIDALCAAPEAPKFTFFHGSGLLGQYRFVSLERCGCIRAVYGCRRVHCRSGGGNSEIHQVVKDVLIWTY